MPVVVRPVDSEGEALFRLPDLIRKKREEEDEKLMEKYAQIEANYQKRLRKAIRRMDWHSAARRKADKEAHGDGIVDRAS